MELYLIRHTETIVEKGVCYGQSDVLLKKPYTEEFALISNQITEKYSIIYSSPLKRCMILSKYLLLYNKNCQMITYDDRLKELNFGLWELKKWEELEADLLNEWMDDFVNTKVPGGESFQQLYHRVNNFIETLLLQREEKGPAIIITHAGVIRSILCYVKNIPLQDAFNLSVPYGSLLKITINDL